MKSRNHIATTNRTSRDQKWEEHPDIVPWQEYTFIGTRKVVYHGEPDEFTVTS
jgi:hypothetical protein